MGLNINLGTKRIAYWGSPRGDQPEKAMATHSSILAWKIPWTEEPGRLQSMGSLRDTTERLHFHFSLSCIGEGNGNPLQCSCLQNPRDRGAWWAAIYGVAQSPTRLKWLSSSRDEQQQQQRWPAGEGQWSRGGVGEGKMSHQPGEVLKKEPGGGWPFLHRCA